MVFKRLTVVGNSLSSVLFIFLIFAGAASAEVSVTLHDQISIPDSIICDDFTVVDLDDDGETELLFESNDFIARYSLAQQTTLDYFLKPSSTEPRKFAYGFLDDDTELDFIEVIIITRSYPDSNSLVALPYLSGNLWVAGDSAEMFRFPTNYWVSIWGLPYSETISAWMLGNQFLMPNNDGDLGLWGEVYLTYTETSDYYDPVYQCGTYKYEITYSYLPGDPSGTTGVALPAWGGIQCDLPDDPLTRAVTFESFYRWTRYLKWCWGTTSTRYYVATFYEGIEPVASYAPVNLCACPAPSINQQYCGYSNTLSLKQYTMGDLLPAWPGCELLVFESHFGSNADGCLNQEYHLRCFDPWSQDTLFTLWDYLVPEGERDIDFLFFEPNIADQFFCFAHDKFLLRDATNGTLSDSSAAISAEAGKMISYKALEAGGTNFAMLLNGNLLSLYVLDVSTDVGDDPPAQSLPAGFTLHQPYPNPFNSELTIPVSLDRAGHLSVRIYNLLGQKVTDVFDGPANPGELSLDWNGRNDAGEEVASGIYLIKATAESGSSMVKCVLLK